ncbi:MAG: hypothetical protein AB8B84_12410 [Granulosicoccus sp.]
MRALSENFRGDWNCLVESTKPTVAAVSGYALVEAQKVAEGIAGYSASAVQLAGESVQAAWESSLQQGLQLERRYFYSLFGSADQQEGMRAFFPRSGIRFSSDNSNAHGNMLTITLSIATCKREMGAGAWLYVLANCPVEIFIFNSGLWPFRDEQTPVINGR